ncbi:hypothetical protein MPTK2_8g17900 [Marchantia polymorpha subsp. ruderalis]
MDCERNPAPSYRPPPSTRGLCAMAPIEIDMGEIRMLMVVVVLVVVIGYPCTSIRSSHCDFIIVIELRCKHSSTKSACTRLLSYL